MLKPEIKAKWLEALRSGNYEQGIGQLELVNTEDNTCKLCCLGVLTKLAVDAGVPMVTELETPYTHDKPPYLALRSYEGATGLLPDVVAEWAGAKPVDIFEVPDTAYYSEGDFAVTHPNSVTPNGTSLAMLNDNGYSFAQIADVIEKQL